MCSEAQSRGMGTSQEKDTMRVIEQQRRYRRDTNFEAIEWWCLAVRRERRGDGGISWKWFSYSRQGAIVYYFCVTEDPCLPLGNDDLLNYTRSLGTSNNRLLSTRPRLASLRKAPRSIVWQVSYALL